MVDYKFEEVNNWSRTLKIGSKVYFPKIPGNKKTNKLK